VLFDGKLFSFENFITFIKKKNYAIYDWTIGEKKLDDFLGDYLLEC